MFFVMIDRKKVKGLFYFAEGANTKDALCESI